MHGQFYGIIPSCGANYSQTRSFGTKVDEHLSKLLAKTAVSVLYFDVVNEEFLADLYHSIDELEKSKRRSCTKILTC
jgi:hypothetical protein